MHKSQWLNFLVTSLFSSPLFALTMLPINTDVANKASFTTTNQKLTPSNTFLSDEAIQLKFNFAVPQTHQGKNANLYLIAKYNDSYYMRTPTGWTPWNLVSASLQTFQSKILAKEENIEVLNHATLPAGEYLVYAGYQLAGEDNLYFNAVPATLAIFDKGSAALHKVRNKEILTEFFDRGSNGFNKGFGGGFSPVASFSPAPTPTPSLVNTAATDSAGSSTPVSQTNLQELGVDESDRIKAKGEQLFALETCLLDSSKQCLSAYRMTAEPAGTQKLGQLNLDMNNYSNGQLYLPATPNQESPQKLVYLNSSFNYPVFSFWFSPYFWGNNQTHIALLDVSQPENMQVKQKITLNSALISSRMLNNVLYLVTRKNPQYTFTPPKPVALGAPASENVTAKAPDLVLLPAPQPEPPSTKDADNLLPTISFDQDPATPLVKSEDCYIPAQSSDKVVDNTLILVTAIPLDNPKQHYSVCVAGNIDTFYMSTQAIYLASSKYPYQLNGSNIVYSAQPQELSTQIHKFALGANTLNYKGSGDVPGHLGWNSDKQPFRMGEYNNILKIATSLGQTWDASSRTRVGVLQEDSASQSLKEIAHLDNLGKPGEQLYAARFIQNRGYLVTFKNTDPLYVLDFKEPSKPEILGELHANGYSDYLHPIGENYLLGIGKDASPSNSATDNDRFAWYQGVKLALYDVTDGNSLKEVDSLIIGKRGTQSAALYDHHALAWLANGTQATLALPIELHNNRYPENYNTYNYNYDYNLPSTYYDWTHTGLYLFSVDTGSKPSLSLSRRIIADANNPKYYGDYTGASTDNDRAVIQGGSVHYLHNNRILSSPITP